MCPRWRELEPPCDPEVVAARGKVEEACLNFEWEPTAERRGELNEAKQFLFSTYDTIKGEELTAFTCRSIIG